MNRTYHAIRQPVRRPYGDTYLLLALLSFAFSVSITRLFLALTGYPQIGGGDLHISHVLWGGLLLFIAALLPLMVANRWVYRVTAILAGVGIGLFIDEVGKFMTSSYDYFFTPAAPIIYAFFLICVLIYLQVSKPRPRNARSELYATLELMEEVLDHDLDENEQKEIKKRLAYVVDQELNPDLNYLARDLLNYFENNQLMLTPAKPGWLQQFLSRARELETKRLDQAQLKRFLVAGILILGIGSMILPCFSIFFYFINFSTGPTSDIFWYISSHLILLAAGILLVYSAILLRADDESRALRISYITLLMYLTIINLFLFYYYQFGTILAALFQFILLMGVIHYQRRYTHTATNQE
ncbi:MAG: hypothetical protein ACK2UE_08265 [Anaerolineales bacterium]|jgi:hypothetical protein